MRYDQKIILITIAWMLAIFAAYSLQIIDFSLGNWAALIVTLACLDWGMKKCKDFQILGYWCILIFFSGLISGYILASSLREKSEREEGVYLVSAQVIKKERHVGRNTKYYLYFNDFKDKYGRTEQVITVSSSEYDECQAGQELLLSQSLYHRHDNLIIRDKNPTRSQIYKYKDGLYIDAADIGDISFAKENEELRSKMLNYRIESDKFIIPVYISIAIILAGTFTSSALVMAGANLLLLFSFFNNDFQADVVDLWYLAFIFMFYGIYKLSRFRGKIELKYFGGYIRPAVLNVYSDKSISLTFNKWDGTELHPDVTLPKSLAPQDKMGVIAAMPFSIEENVIVIGPEGPPEESRKFFNGLFFKGGDFSDLQKIENCDELREIYLLKNSPQKYQGSQKDYPFA